MTDPNITIRIAEPHDTALLRRLELESPLADGADGAFHVDRGEDYLAQRRMMGDPTVLIAEVDGEPAGTMGAVLHPAIIGGLQRRMLYFHHARILPRFQRIGIGRAFSDRLYEIYAKDGYDSAYWWIDRGNEASQGMASTAPNRWSVGVTWGQIETARHADAAPIDEFAGVATAADVGRLADILNAGHVGEQMFLPYSVERLRRRLDREPGHYGWAQLYNTDGAAVGVWPHWVTLRRTRRGEPVGETDVDATVIAATLDYGCIPGHEEELVALIRSWCRTLHDRGVGRLSLFASSPARLYELVRPLFDEIEEMDFWTPDLPEPPASRYGVYVDHVYF